MSLLQINRYTENLTDAAAFPTYGRVTHVAGLVVEGYCPGAVVGAICEVISENRKERCLAEVIGFKEDKVLLMPLGELRGIGSKSAIVLKQQAATAAIGPGLLGRVIDGLGRPLDGGPEIDADEEFYLYSKPVNPLKRALIRKPLDLGIRAVNGLLTFGEGQRVGIIAGSGVGKSVLLGMMARSSSADVNVIGMIGERGREIREFIENYLGEETLSRTVMITATSDVPPLIRMRAAFLTATVAEYFRKQGKRVLLMMDSITRFAMAQREVGLAAGEPPTTKGYPPSVFTQLPKLLERAGNTSSGGSITGIYTVLVEADDVNDPIGDAVRSIVDGHLVLSRKLAARNHFPAIDVPYSGSRVMSAVVTPEHIALAGRMKSIIARYSEAEDLINIGAYVKGSNPSIDEAIQYIEPIREFLRQNLDEKTNFEQSLQRMRAIFANDKKTQEAPKVGRR